MRYVVVHSLLVVFSFTGALFTSAACLKSHLESGHQNIYWHEIQSSVSKPDSVFSQIKRIENPAVLSVLFDVEWSIHHGKKPSFFEAIGRDFLFNAVSSVGQFVVLRPDDAPSLHALVDELAHAMNIKKPMIIYSEVGLFNAFAAGLSTKNSCIFLCRGMLEKISAESVAGVIAHELGHIMHNHTMKKFVSMAGIGIGLSSFLLYGGYQVCTASKKTPVLLRSAAQGLVLGVTGMLLDFFYARRCEWQADQAMIAHLQDRGGSMLQSMLHYEDNVVNSDVAVVEDLIASGRFNELTDAQHSDFRQRLAKGHMFMNNLHNCRGVNALFSSHPTTKERLAKVFAEEES